MTVVTEEYAPYNYTQSGKVTGFCAEIVEATLKKAGLQYDLQSYPWARAYNMALENPNTLIFSIRRTSERENKFKWGSVITKADIYLYKLKERKDIQLKTLADAKKYKTVVIPEDASTQKLIEQGFELKKNLQMSPVAETNVRMIHLKRVDLVPEDELGMFYLAKEDNIDPTLFVKTIMIPGLPSELYMAFSLKTPDDIILRCKKAFKEIRKNRIYQSIKEKYLK